MAQNKVLEKHLIDGSFSYAFKKLKSAYQTLCSDGTSQQNLLHRNKERGLFLSACSSGDET